MISQSISGTSLLAKTVSCSRRHRRPRPLQQLAGDHRVAIIVVHHLRKQDADDWTDTITGSTGLTGAVDTVLAMHRDRGQLDAVLLGTGRDLDEYEKALRFDAGHWVPLGEAKWGSRERHDPFCVTISGGDP